MSKSEPHQELGQSPDKLQQNNKQAEQRLSYKSQQMDEPQCEIGNYNEPNSTERYYSGKLQQVMEQNNLSKKKDAQQKQVSQQKEAPQQKEVAQQKEIELQVRNKPQKEAQEKQANQSSAEQEKSASQNTPKMRTL